jgi:hypothetical protein
MTPGDAEALLGLFLGIVPLFSAVMLFAVIERYLS